MEKLQVSCPPDTYLLIQEDEDYRQQVTSRILNSGNSQYKEIIFSPIKEIGNEKEKHVWLEAPTKLLLSLIQELQPKVAKTFSVKTKAKMWEIISEKLAENGHKFTPLQIENRFRTLERQYKKTNLHNKQTGRNKETCQYQIEVDQILGKKRGINPDYILDSSEIEGTSRSCSENNNVNVVEDFNGDATSKVAETSKDEDDVPNCVPKRKKMNPQDRPRKIEEIFEERKEYHRQVLEFLKKNDERAARKEERANKKLELLEALVSKIK